MQITFSGAQIKLYCFLLK